MRALYKLINFPDRERLLGLNNSSAPGSLTLSNNGRPEFIKMFFTSTAEILGK
jgi:hypothetical protein